VIVPSLRPWLSKIRDALVAPCSVNLVMHLEDVIEGVWWYTWRQRLSNFRNALGGHHRASLEINREDIIY